MSFKPTKLDEMPDEEKMFTLFAGRGTDSKTSLSKKIQYTEAFLSVIRKNPRKYSSNKATYVSNYLKELREKEKKETAANTANSGTGSAVKAPNASSGAVKTEGSAKKDSAWDTFKSPWDIPEPKPKQDSIPDMLKNIMNPGGRDAQQGPVKTPEKDTSPWKISYEIEDGYDYRIRSPQKTDPEQLVNLTSKTLKEINDLIESGSKPSDAIRNKHGSLTETVSRAKSMKEYLKAHPDEFTKDEYTNLNDLIDQILDASEPVLSGVPRVSSKADDDSINWDEKISQKKAEIYNLDIMARDYEKEIGECEKIIEKYGSGSSEGIKAQMRISEIRQIFVDYGLKGKRGDLNRELDNLNTKKRQQDEVNAYKNYNFKKQEKYYDKSYEEVNRIMHLSDTPEEDKSWLRQNIGFFIKTDGDVDRALWENEKLYKQYGTEMEKTTDEWTKREYRNKMDALLKEKSVLQGLKTQIAERGKFEVYRYDTDFKKLSAFDSSVDDDTYYAVNHRGKRKTPDSISYAAEKAFMYEPENNYGELTKEEKELYNAIYKKKGGKAAKAYLNSIESILSARAYETYVKEMREKVKDSPELAAWGSVGTVIAAPVKGIAGAAAFVDDTINVLTGKGIDPNSEAHMFGNQINAFRGAVSDEYASKWFKGANVGGFNIGGLTYNALMNVGDSVMNMLTMQGAAGAVGLSRQAAERIISTGVQTLTGSTVYANAVVEGKRKGYSDIGALSLGVVRGLIEGATEKWSIEQILKEPANLFDGLAKSSFGESSGDLISNWANKLVDFMVLEETDIDAAVKKYKKQGKNDLEAASLAIVDSLKDDGVSFFMAAISGAAMSGAYHGANAVIEKVSPSVDYRGIANDGIKPVADEGTISLKFAERGETNKLKASVLTKLIKHFLDGNKLSEQQRGVIGNDVNAMAILKEYMTKGIERANMRGNSVLSETDIRPVGKVPIESLNSYTNIALPKTIGSKGAATYRRLHKDFLVTEAKEPNFNMEFSTMYKAGLRGIPFEMVEELGTMNSLLKKIVYNSGAADAKAITTNQADNTLLTNKGKDGNIDVDSGRVEAPVTNEGAGKATKYFDDVQLKTEPNKSYFWSGKSNGIGGVDTARSIAGKNGGVTLESTIESQGIKMPKYDLSNQASINAWENASAAYARQASGEVRAIIGSNVNPQGIWNRVELPALKANPNVTKIITIDPETLVETIIFTR